MTANTGVLLGTKCVLTTFTNESGIAVVPFSDTVLRVTDNGFQAACLSLCQTKETKSMNIRATSEVTDKPLVRIRPSSDSIGQDALCEVSPHVLALPFLSLPPTVLSPTVGVVKAEMKIQPMTTLTGRCTATPGSKPVRNRWKSEPRCVACSTRFPFGIAVP